MDYYVLDWESYYSSKDGYTLKKMTTEEYLNDPRFHAFGFSISRNGGKPLWVPEEKIEPTLRQLKLHKHAVIMHNAQFDAAILNWKYNVRPKLIVDTLAMARGILGNEERLSLDELSNRYNLGTKGDAVLHMDGVRHPSPQMEKKLGEYACMDAYLTWKLWEVLKTGFPKIELIIVDITTRMFSEPTFVLDRVPIERELQLGDERREHLLTQANCTLADLRSDTKFAELLESLGVTPPKKLSAKKTAALQKKDPAADPVYTWAFAKSDADFKHLGEHDDELVRWAVEARLGLKSTIKQSRAERFLGIVKRMGVMPVALTYYGAGTGRYSASPSAKVNMQNLPALRGSKDPDVGLLRRSLKAPKGEKVVVVDASQIEARFVVWQAGQQNVLEAFAQGRDVYSEMASVIFGRHVDRKKNSEDYIPGFLGKCVVLGCFAPDTQVLTSTGWKCIVLVKDTDLLWDGEEWVKHSGLVNRGVREVHRAYGVSLTPDHEILTEHGWQEWSEVHTSRFHFLSALSLATLPSLVGSNITAQRVGPQDGTRSCDARVDGEGKLTGPTSWRVTVGRPQLCKRKSMTYDIALAGPRSRFTIATSAGPVIAHNCGYGMGHVKFGNTVYGGMLGGPRVLFDDTMVQALGVDLNDYSRYIRRMDNIRDRLVETKPSNISGESWIKHMACAKNIVDAFRQSNPAIPEYWKLGDDMLHAMWRGDTCMIGHFQMGKNFLVLPNGMKLHFKELEKTDDGFTCLRKKDGRVKRVKMYGGAVVENLSQALAGAYVKEAMVRAHMKGYRPILQVHDEIVVITDESDADNAFRVVSACMETVPSWATGLPLASDGGFADSYGECK